MTPAKRVRKPEQRRLSRFLRGPISATLLSQPTGGKLAEFRDRRMNDGFRTAKYDLTLIKHWINIIRLEWGVPTPSSPVDWVRTPNGIKRRERRLRHGEYEALTKAAQSGKNVLIWTIVDFAIETGMQRSEILVLRREYLSDQ